MSLGSGGQECCKKCKGCVQYKKIVNIEKADLFIRRLTRKTNVTSKNNSTFDSDKVNYINNLITQNSENVEISSREFTYIEHFEIKCLRCRKLLQAQSPNKDRAIAICDHCRMNTSQKLYAECKKTVSELFSNLSEETKTNTIFTQKFHEVPNAVATKKKELHEELKYTFRSNLYNYITPDENYEPGMQQIDHNRKCNSLSSLLFIKDPALIQNLPNFKLAHSVKKNDERDVAKPKYQVETDIELKNEESLQELQGTTYYRNIQSESEKYLDDKYKHRNSILIPSRNMNEMALTSKKNFQDIDINIRRYHSEEILPQSFMSTVDGFIGEDFSYLFPYERDVAKTIVPVTSSSELIKNTIDRFRKEKEEEQRKKAEEQHKKEQERKIEEAKKKEVKKMKVEKERKAEDVTKKKDDILKKKLEDKEVQSATIYNTEMENINDNEKGKNTFYDDKKIEPREQTDKMKKKRESFKNEKTDDKIVEKHATQAHLKSELKSEYKESEYLKEKGHFTKVKKILDKKKQDKGEDPKKDTNKIKAELKENKLIDKSSTILFGGKKNKRVAKEIKAEPIIGQLGKKESKLSQEKKQKTELIERQVKVTETKEPKNDKLVETQKEKKDKKEPKMKDNLETITEKKETTKAKEGSKKERDTADEAGKKFKELLALHAKETEEISKMNKKQLDDEEKAKELLEKKIKEAPNENRWHKSDVVDGLKPSIGELKKRFSDSKPLVNKLEQTEKPVNEVKLKNIKLQSSYSDDLILRLVKVQQMAKRSRDNKEHEKISHLNLSAYLIRSRQRQLDSNYDLQRSSDLELDIESSLNENKSENVLDMIVGQKIIKRTLPTVDKSKKEEHDKVNNTQFEEEPVFVESYKIKEEVHIDVKQESVEKTGKLRVDQEIPKGITRYVLSDRSFIEKGWTMLPTEKVVRKMNVYRMRPAHPEFDWFARNKNRRHMEYDSGERLAEFDDNGRGRWYYKNGRLALDYYDAEEINAQQRIVIYSNGEPDELGKTRPMTVLATFDYLGNGIVFDHSGKIRLKYNQTEGIVLDRNVGPVSHWKWHTLNDPPILQQVMIDTQMPHKDIEISKMGDPKDTKVVMENEEMLAIEFHNFVKEKSKKLTQKFKPFQIKMKALKINENFSLRVLDQATIYLIFRDGSTNLKLNIGLVLDYKEIVDTESAEVGEVASGLEHLPARTDSLAFLQHCIVNAQHFAKQRTERERRIRPTKPIPSADKLIAATSKPLQPPFQVMPSNSSFPAGECQCFLKKSACNLHYNNHFL